MDSEIRLGGHAGLGALFDLALWLQLARRALSPMVVAQALVAVVLLLVTTFLTLALPRWALLLVPLGFTLWLWPPVLRWFIGVVALRAVRDAAQDEGVEPLELPPVSDWRAWWRPSLICWMALAPMSQVGLLDNLVAVLAFSALQAWLATPALVRSLLAPWFPQTRIAESLRTDRQRWLVLTAFWMLTFVVLHAIARQVLGLTFADMGADAARAQANGHPVGTFLAALSARLLGLVLVTAAVGIFCTAAMARMAAHRLLGEPAAQVAFGSPLSFDLLRESAERARGATRGMTAVVGGVLVVLLLWPLLHRPVLLSLLHVERGTEQAQRNQLACDGQTFKVRMLHWAGVDSAGGPHQTALACAASHGHLATVKLLVDLGDSVTWHVDDPRYAGTTTHLSPILQALQSEKGLPAADYMLAHGTDTAGALADRESPDAVQAAAMSHCMPCVEWAVRHDAPVGGTWQATPMALWLDNAGRGSHEVANLQHLKALGLSGTAIGEDGRSALHAAANNGDLDAVNWLLGEGADPSRTDSDGNTPVLYAAVRLGFGPDNHRVGQEDPADRERVLVVQRLIGVSQTLDHGSANSPGHKVLWSTSPYADGPVDFATATYAYRELQEQIGSSLAELVDPSQ